MSKRKAPHRLLLMALLNLGDVVMLTAAVAALKEKHPNVHITIVVRQAACAVVIDNPLFDEVIVSEYRSGQVSLVSELRMIRRIRKGGHDVAICLDQKLRSMLYLLFAGQKHRVLSDGVFGNARGLKTRIAHEVLRTRLEWKTHHIVEHIVDVFSQVYGLIDCSATRVSIGEIGVAQRRKAEELVIRAGMRGKKRVVFCPKSTFALKDWLPERWAEITKLIAEEFDVSCYFVGTASDRDYSQKIIAKSGCDCDNLCGETTVPELAAVLSISDLLVTVDTGTGHIAAAAGTPVLVLHCCTNPQRCRPYSKKCRALWSERSCSPCNKRPQECVAQFCAHEITVANVVGAVREFLADARACGGK